MAGKKATAAAAAAVKGATKKGGKEKAVKLTGEDLFESQLAESGIAGAMRLADTYDNNYEVTTSGFPGINLLISDDPKLQGIPNETHMEIFSEVEHVGKTTFTLLLGVARQLLGQRVGVVDIEPSITLAYLRLLGYITTKAEAEAKSKELGYTVYAVRLLQPQVKAEECETDMVYVDKVLDTVGIAANIFDFLVVDSVDALVSEADAAKTTNDPTQMGGVAKPIKAFMRRHSKNRSTIAWINHMSQGLGQYARSYTTGGKAIPRYSTIRFKLDRVDWIKPTPESDPVGFITKVTTIKNRLGPIGRSTLLYYIFGEGFSSDYDYFLQALKLGVIVANGAWHYFGTKEDSKLTVQGRHNFYLALKGNREIMADLKKVIDGEDVEIELGEEQLSPEDLLDAMAVPEEEDEAVAA